MPNLYAELIVSTLKLSNMPNPVQGPNPAEPIVPTKASQRRYDTPPQPLQVAQIAEALLTINTVMALTGLSKSTVYTRMREGTFVQSVHLSGKRCTRWPAGPVMKWLAAQGQGASV